jgi:homoserine dehydrogenase
MTWEDITSVVSVACTPDNRDYISLNSYMFLSFCDVFSAKDVVFKAIAAGKNVVTANKALIAAFLPEIQELLAKHPKVSFNYEAAVCGGIPIIHSLQTDFLADKVTKIRGIMNGTVRCYNGIDHRSTCRYYYTAEILYITGLNR